MLTASNCLGMSFDSPFEPDWLDGSGVSPTHGSGKKRHNSQKLSHNLLNIGSDAAEISADH